MRWNGEEKAKKEKREEKMNMKERKFV